MRQIRDMGIIEIDVTNVCNKSCTNCTRFCGHYTKDKIYNLDLKYIEDILITLKDFDKNVGLIGGEPTLHPEIDNIAKLYKKYRDKKSCLFTNTEKSYRYDEYFGLIHVNKHDGTQAHTGLLVSSESVKNKYNIPQEEIDKYIDKCWIQLEWSATVNPKGAFFCEVAGMLSYLYNGPDGLNIYEHPEWWKYDLSKFQYQIDWACKQCGGAMPLKPKPSNIEIDDVSEDNLEKLKSINSPKILKNKYEIYNDEFLYN